MSREVAERLTAQIIAMARICDPKNNASDGEKSNAARMIERLVPRLVEAASGRSSTAYGRTSPPSPELDRACLEWRQQVGQPATVEQRADLGRFLQRGLALDEILSAIATTAHRRPDDPWRYFCAICWNRIREGANARRQA